MTPKPLAGRGAVVTGGGRGIGEAAAKLLADAGARVAVSARSRDEIASVADSIAASGGRAVAITCDVTREEDVRELGRRARAELGQIDILVMSAGAASSAPFDRIDVAQWDEMMDANAKSAFLCAREFALPRVRRHGAHGPDAFERHAEDRALARGRAGGDLEDDRSEEAPHAGGGRRGDRRARARGVGRRDGASGGVLTGFLGA
jgi:NAD(P)-dependent dehydrogenase (short-subunit alcohol dehydrogenase family)